MKIFYHIYGIKGYERLVNEQMKRLFNSGLLENEIRIYMNKGRENITKIIEKYTKNYKIKFNKDNLFEYEAIKGIWDYSQNHDDKIFYFHTKGISKKTKQETAWRRYMEYFLIDNWKECIKELDKFHVVGVNAVTMPYSIESKGKVDMTLFERMAMIGSENQTKMLPHFSGNFWWSKTSYLRSLPEPQKPMGRKLYDRMQYEIWIGSGEFMLGRTMNQNNKAHYKTTIKEKDYK